MYCTSDHCFYVQWVDSFRTILLPLLLLYTGTIRTNTHPEKAWNYITHKRAQCTLYFFDYHYQCFTCNHGDCWKRTKHTLEQLHFFFPGENQHRNRTQAHCCLSAHHYQGIYCCSVNSYYQWNTQHGSDRQNVARSFWTSTSTYTLNTMASGAILSV